MDPEMPQIYTSVTTTCLDPRLPILAGPVNSQVRRRSRGQPDRLADTIQPSHATGRLAVHSNLLVFSRTSSR